MPSSIAMNQVLATLYANTGPYLTLLKALTMQSSAAVGATSCSVDLSVAVGDKITFDLGLATEGTKVVSAVSGTGPYTISFNALLFAHASGSLVSHMPLAAVTVHELAVTRCAANWGTVDSTATVTSSASPIAVSAGMKLGAVAVFSAISAGTYYDATPVACISYGSSNFFAPVYSFQET